MTLLKSASSVLTTNSSSALPSTIPTTSTVSPSACFRDGHSMSLASARTSPKKPDPIPAPEDEEEGEAPPSLSAARAALILARSAGERPPPGVSAPAEAARAAAWREVVFGVFGFWRRLGLREERRAADQDEGLLIPRTIFRSSLLVLRPTQNADHSFLPVAPVQPQQQQQSRRCRCRSPPLTRTTAIRPPFLPAHRPRTRPRPAGPRPPSPLPRGHACVPAERGRRRRRGGSGGSGSGGVFVAEEGDEQQRLDFSSAAMGSSRLPPYSA